MPEPVISIMRAKSGATRSTSCKVRQMYQKGTRATKALSAERSQEAYVSYL